MGLRQNLFRLYRAAALPTLLGVERIQTGALFFPAGRRFFADPYRVYRRLRERDPVHGSRLFSGWVLTRYADVLEVLRDPSFSSDERNRSNFERQREMARRLGILDEDEPQPSMLRLDPPDHTRLRSLVNKAFTPRAVEKRRERIEGIAHELLAAAPSSGQIDLMQLFAGPLPVVVIAEMLGVPGEDQARFKHWSNEVVGAMGVARIDDVRRARAAGRELRTYLEGVAEERRREPRDDLLSALLTAEEEGDRLTLGEVFQTCNLLLIAGNETTTNLIGNGLLALFRHPDQLARLRDDPSLIPGAVEELLRYDSPVQFTTRIVREPKQIAGVTFERGQEIVLVVGAANRDPAQFPDPDQLDLGRERVAHLSFGHGIHFCLGAQLARLEGQIAIRAFLDHYPKAELASDAPVWGRNSILRGLRSLPVRV